MRTDKYMMAKAWMKQDQAPQAEALETWNTLEAEFNEERKAMLMASAESDKIKTMMNEKYGPGTVKYGSEIPQPEIKTPQAAFEFSQRNPAADGGRMGFDNGLSALSFGKEQSIFTPQTLQKILTKGGQKQQPQAYKVIIDALKKSGIEYTAPKLAGSSATFNNVTKKTIKNFNKEATKLRADAGLPMSRYQTDKIKNDIVIFVKDKIKREAFFTEEN